MINLLPLLLILLLVAGLVQAAIENRIRFERRIQIFELLALATRRELPLVPMLHKAAVGQPRTMRKMLRFLSRDLEEGECLSEALEWAGPTTFPPQCRAAVAAAEGTAQLPHVLAALAEQTDDSLVLRHRVVMALVYPLSLFLGVIITRECVMRVYATGLTGGVDPTAEWFSLGGVSSFFRFSRGSPLYQLNSTVGLAVCVIVSIYFTLVLWRRLPIVRRLAADLASHVSWQFRGARYLAASNFLSTLSHVVTAGVTLPEALRRAAGAAGNTRFETRIVETAEAMESGVSPQDAWPHAGLPRVAEALIGTVTNGSKVQLGDVLARAARECRERYVASRERFVQVLHPASVLVFGALLAGVFSAMLQFGGLVAVAEGLW